MKPIQAATQALVILVAVIGAPAHLPALAQDDSLFERAVLTTFTGEFQWTTQVQPIEVVTMRFITLRHLDAHRIEATGCGRYNTAGHITDIRVRMIADEATRAVEIWESDPIGDASTFVTAGSHKGKLAADLKGIAAVWTTTATGEQGELRLHAGGSLTCIPQVASVH
jgi:hypothetical protein